MNRNMEGRFTEGRIHPSEVAKALNTSIEDDLEAVVLDPTNPTDLLTLAHWGSRWGIFEQDIRAEKGVDMRPRIPLFEVADWIRRRISPHPERFREIVEVCRELEKRYLKAQADRLEGCDTVWWRQYVVRIFWRDRWGRERLRRQIGIHRCKHAWCPKCGRSRQAKLSSETEKTLLLARDFGFHEGHGRLVTLTVPNGSNLLLLRDQAHHAFAKLQRTRWWNRHVFGWIRGSEVVTGKDGNWNLHLHLLVIF